MAGMFYSLQEVAEKLSKTEEEVKQIVKAGRLREFRDGPNLLFKVDEVEALMSETTVMQAEVPMDIPQQGTKEDEISLPPEPSDSALPEIELPKESTEEKEVSLSPETSEGTSAEGELGSGDTAMVSEGTDVLGETDSSSLLTDDTAADTKAMPSESSLEKIEEDVNLDSFGSGSGLLDLSLQADDTSLGGILDEIYTSEDGGSDTEGSAADVTAEAEQILSEEELGGIEMAGRSAAMVRAYAEPEPDTVSNALGIMLFLPLLVIVYTAVVVIAGFNNIMPAVLETVQGLIWYILGGIGVAAVLIVGAAFMFSGKDGVKAGKKKKVKKQKAKKT